MKISRWKGVSFMGGGVTGISHAGVLEVMNEYGILQQITHVSGSSAGSMFAILVACKVPYESIKEDSLNMDYSSLQDSSWFVFSDIYNLVKNYGWSPGDAIVKMVGDNLERYVGNRNITFGQIKNLYNMTLIITSTDIVSETTIYYTPDTHPDKMVADACRESSGIPLVYSPIFKDNMCLVDGGLLTNYPIRILYDYLPKEEVFGVALLTNGSTAPVNSKIPKNIIEYLTKIIIMLHNRASNAHIEDDDWARTIKVNSGTTQATDKITYDQKIELINQGIIAAKKFF